VEKRKKKISFFVRLYFSFFARIVRFEATNQKAQFQRFFSHYGSINLYFYYYDLVFSMVSLCSFLFNRIARFLFVHL